MGRKNKPTKLPGNIYVAEFPREDEKTSDLIKNVKIELEKILNEKAAKAKFFILAGTGWAWSVGNTQDN